MPHAFKLLLAMAVLVAVLHAQLGLAQRAAWMRLADEAARHYGWQAALLKSFGVGHDCETCEQTVKQDTGGKSTLGVGLDHEIKGADALKDISIEASICVSEPCENPGDSFYLVRSESPDTPPPRLLSFA